MQRDVVVKRNKGKFLKTAGKNAPPPPARPIIPAVILLVVIISVVVRLILPIGTLALRRGARSGTRYKKLGGCGRGGSVGGQQEGGLGGRVWEGSCVCVRYRRRVYGCGGSYGSEHGVVAAVCAACRYQMHCYSHGRRALRRLSVKVESESPSLLLDGSSLRRPGRRELFASGRRCDATATAAACGSAPDDDITAPLPRWPAAREATSRDAPREGRPRPRRPRPGLPRPRPARTLRDPAEPVPSPCHDGGASARAGPLP